MNTQDTGANELDAVSPLDMNIRAPSYFVLQTGHHCAACKQSTPVFALAVPPDHESTEADIELDEDSANTMGLDPDAFHDWLFSPVQWLKVSGPAMISQTSLLSESVAQTLQGLAPAFRPDPASHGQWTNFCEHCGKAVWEGLLYPTVGQPFCPKDDIAAARINVHTVNAPFAAFYGMCWTDSYRNKWPLFKRLGVECSEAD